MSTMSTMLLLFLSFLFNFQFVNLKNSKCPSNCVKPCKIPLVFEEDDLFKVEFLQRFRWVIYTPRLNWFYDPQVNIGETPCTVFRNFNSGIDVTIFAPGRALPICSTLRNNEDLCGFMLPANVDCKNLDAETYLITCRRAAYAFNLISGCGQVRTVVISKALDEFPLGYNYQIVKNPNWSCKNFNFISNPDSNSDSSQD